MDKNMTKLIFKFLVLGVCVGILWYYQVLGSSQAGQTRVTASEQQGSPIQILSTYVDATDPLQPIYGYTLTNNTDKAIAAYAIVETIRFGPGSAITSTALTDFATAKLFLGAHESRQEQSGQGKTYKLVPVEVVLSVDFVEFADGTRWGDDSSRSRQKLEGKRAGGKAAMKAFRESFATGGLVGLQEALENPASIRPEGDRSSEWLDGFKIGVATVKTRLGKAKGRGGLEETKRELQKPFDPTAGRTEP